MNSIQEFAKDKKKVFLVSIIARVILFGVSIYLDNFTSTGYSDIDYKVFTDGAKYVLENKSPFERHTYRYTPLLAYLMTPNIFLN